MFFVDLYMQTLSLLIMTTRDVNDAELLMPSRDFYFRKKNEPELRLYPNEPESRLL